MIHKSFGWPAPMLQLVEGTYRELLPPPIPIRNQPREMPREMRHPAAADVGWGAFPNAHRLNHVALGDIIDTLGAIGFEVRLQVRNKANRE